MRRHEQASGARRSLGNDRAAAAARAAQAKGGRPRVPDRACLSGIKVRIARKGIDASDRLGRHRWVVERTLAWLGQFRRLTIRYDRRDDIHDAFLTLGCSLICCNAIQRYC